MNILLQVVLHIIWLWFQELNVREMLALCLQRNCSQLHQKLRKKYLCQKGKNEIVLVVLWWWWIVFWEWLSTKGIKLYLQSRPLSGILTITYLWHATSRIWTCAEPEFRLNWTKLYSSDNHYTMVPLVI